MDVKLIVVGGKHAGQEVEVPGPRFFIGRAEDCHLRPQSEQISRHHAAILIESGFVAVRDLGSRNGTYVNGELLTGEHELKNGDRLKLGPLEFEVELAVSLSGKKKPKVHSVEEAAARAAESGSQANLDIFNLLGEETQPPSKPIAEKPTVSSTPTAEVNQQEADTVTGKPAKDEPKEKPKGEEGKQTGFREKLDKAKEEIGDTRSAATEALRQFMKRR